MFERGIREEEIDHVIAFGLSIKKNEVALPLPKEEISCYVGSRLVSVVVGINHASKTRIVITVYAKGKKR
jgi:hypothetical protein